MLWIGWVRWYPLNYNRADAAQCLAAELPRALGSVSQNTNDLAREAVGSSGVFGGFAERLNRRARARRTEPSACCALLRACSARARIVLTTAVLASA